MTTVSCEKCGRQIASTARWCPDCGTPLGKSVKCRSCGNAIPVSGRGCHHCGAIGTAAYGPASVILVFFILLAVGGFGLLAYFLNQQHEEGKKQMQRENQEWRKKHGFEK